MTDPVDQSNAVAGSRFDPIAMEIFNNRMLSITENMALHMTRSSYSAQIKERRDFSVGIFDPSGKLITQGSQMPIHLGSLLGSMEAVLSRYSISDMIDGDAFVCNDPYLAGGTHLPDISIVTPVFAERRVIAFAANIGHHTDLGGSVPGSISSAARSIFEEGLRIPVIRLARGGELDEDLLSFIASNSRLPKERDLDLKVQIAVNQRGAADTRALFLRMGLAETRSAIEDVFTYTAQRLARRIATLPKGKHSFTTYLDDDGSASDPLPIVATVTLDGSSLHIDFDGTGTQAVGAFNVPGSALRATIYYCVKTLIDPDLMPNSGMFAGVTISAPKGTIANPNPPAACGARSTTCQKIAGAVFGAFREVLSKDRLIASSHDVMAAFGLAGEDPSTGGFYVAGETLGGGGGARFDADGMDAIHVHITNSLNLPVEMMETLYPLHCEEYALAVDSGGAGRQRGGLGIVRQIRALNDETSARVRFDCYIHGAAGIDGGGTGGLSVITQNAGRPDEKSLPTKISKLHLRAGESIRVQTPGGGGFGAASERSLQALKRDLRDGVVTRGAAERDYGEERVALALAFVENVTS